MSLSAAATPADINTGKTIIVRIGVRFSIYMTAYGCLLQHHILNNGVGDPAKQAGQSIAFRYGDVHTGYGMIPTIKGAAERLCLRTDGNPFMFRQINVL